MSRKNLKWFTFIEILVVIAVFAIWVFAVVRLLISNMINVDAVKTNNSAIFLAKEWMDIVYNIKNSNIGKGLRWDCVLKDDIDPNVTLIWNVDDVCKYSFSSGITDKKIFQIWFSTTWYFQVNQLDDGDFNKNFESNKLFFYTWSVAGERLSRYGYSGLNYPSSDTKFARYIKFKPIMEWWKELPTDKIIKIESHVLFKNGVRTWNVVLESFISAY